MEQVSSPVPESDDHQKLVVLVVDDQAMVVEAIRRLLQSEPDIEFHSCTDPKQAVTVANRVCPSVILQDLVMPDVDGYTLLRFYRANAQTTSVPVIVLSAKEDPQDKSQAFSNGASDYLVKVPSAIELIARIRAHSRSYLAQRQRDEAYQTMQELQKKLELSNKKLEESNKVLHRLSVLDGLTGIANRRHFDEILMQEWKRGTRDKNGLSLILLDIDYFKKFNDNYGHQGGDDCLRRVAGALNEVLHRPGDLLARYGGEEFAAILPETDAAGAQVIAEQMRARIESLNITHEFSEVTNHVTISLGIAHTVPDAAASPHNLLAKADEALYLAKKSGRNCHKLAN